MAVNFDYSNAIEVHNLDKSYKGFSLSDVSFNVPAGCITGFIGQNGAGKSTTIKAILNMISRDGGSIKVFGADNICEELHIKENIGVVFDDIGFHEKLKPKHINVIMRNIYKEWDDGTFFKYLERFNIPCNKKVGELSRGMKMKLQIATALAHNARLLIMDEPTGGLDPIVRNEILDIFMDFIQDSSHTVFLSSHIITDIERIADYVVFINKGKILLSEEKDRIADRHGIIRCAEKQLEKLDKADIISMRKSSFGVELLVGDYEQCRVKYSNLLCEKTSLEEIMLFYVNNSQHADDFNVNSAK